MLSATPWFLEAFAGSTPQSKVLSVAVVGFYCPVVVLQGWMWLKRSYIGPKACQHIDWHVFMGSISNTFIRSRIRDRGTAIMCVDVTDSEAWYLLTFATPARDKISARLIVKDPCFDALSTASCKMLYLGRFREISVSFKIFLLTKFRSAMEEKSKLYKRKHHSETDRESERVSKHVKIDVCTQSW